MAQNIRQSTEPTSSPPPAGSPPTVRPFDETAFRWAGVDVQQYKEHKGTHPGEGWQEITRQVLAGSYGEPASFRLRYFEVGPGGYSSLEKHAHVHVVVTLRGRGQAIVGPTVQRVQPFDLVYVPSWTPHQFVNDGDEPYGFLCIVDGDRDRPQPLTPAEIKQLQAHPEVAAVMRLGGD